MRQVPLSSHAIAAVAWFDAIRIGWVSGANKMPPMIMPEKNTAKPGAARRLPVRHFTSVAGSSRARSSSYREHFVNAAEPAWNVPCPWHDHSCCGSRRQRDATSLRIRDVPPPCCVRLSWCFLIASRRMSAPEHMVPLRSIHNPAMVVEQIKVVKGTPSCFRCYGTFRLNAHTSTAARYKPTCSPSC